jgi:hypothetical protein
LRLTFAVYALLGLSLTGAAHAGYGDIDANGYPNWGERSLHLWTNAVRVDPEAFSDRYEPCDFDDFQPEEQTPKSLLYYDFDLNDAARFHTDDMRSNNHFDHDSSDGTSFFDRMARFYGDSSWIGENIALGYGSSASVLFQGWMCSSGHRYNIMLADYNELGTGVLDLYYTQDFAAGLVETTSPIAMGVHEPMEGVGTVTFLADWEGMTPDSMSVIVDGNPREMTLTWGVANLGVYAHEASVFPGCHEYYFRWTRGDFSDTFPEDGSFLMGSCDEPIMWIDSQHGLGDADGDTGGDDWGATDPKLACLCANTRATGRTLIWWLALAGLIARRRV